MNHVYRLRLIMLSFLLVTSVLATVYTNEMLQVMVFMFTCTYVIVGLVFDWMYPSYRDTPNGDYYASPKGGMAKYCNSDVLEHKHRVCGAQPTFNEPYGRTNDGIPISYPQGHINVNTPTGE